MKIQFDSNQQYQLDAINAIVDLFNGQLHGNWVTTPTPQINTLFDHAVYGNQLQLTDENLLTNLQAVQERNHLPLATALAGMNFTVEMETATGKTYVYLRTIFELYLKYGWSKFIIVVPTVAIREGVQTSLRLMAEHFEALYNRLPYRAFVYNSARLTEIRNFAIENTLNLMIMNIDAFNKSGNVINRSDDALLGYSALQFIQQVHPILILDEPQNLEGEKARDAIQSLNPLCTLRYSATHRETYNLVYRLGPIAAYDLGLVKRIEVDGVVEDANFNHPHIVVKEIITSKKQSPVAKLELDVAQAKNIKRSIVKINSGDDLRKKTGRDLYRGYIVDEINAADNEITFTNGIQLNLHDGHGTPRDAIMREQVRQTVRRHFEKELRFSRRPEGSQLKVLSLFFIDRVANYAPADGPIRLWFIEAYNDLKNNPKFTTLPLPPVEQVHAGYFAIDRDKKAKDTSGKTEADNSAYELIMRDKERLLSRTEPVRFIFSHSALNEGWDNPNVFQICTLNESHSDLDRRQRIGRGLRLPVMESGERSFEEQINVLTVIANESHSAFAEALQREIHEDTGADFSKQRVNNARERVEARLNKHLFISPEFKQLWDKISPKTRYAVQYDTQELINRAAAELRKLPAVSTPKIVITTGQILRESQMDYKTSRRREVELTQKELQIPDILGYLQQATDHRLTRTTLAEIIHHSGYVESILTNPQAALDNAVRAIKRTLQGFMIEGIYYEKIAGEAYEMRLFESEELTGYLSAMIATPNYSLYDHVAYQSAIELTFAKALEARDDIKLYVKLPAWFMIETPIGTYNPDWAIVKEDDTTLYFVRETKSTPHESELREEERQKIHCGRAHFQTLNVDFDVVTTHTEI